MSPPARSSRRGRKGARAFDRAVDNDSLSRMASTPITVSNARRRQSSSPVVEENGNLPELNLSRVHDQNQVPQSPQSPFVNGSVEENQLQNDQSPVQSPFLNERLPLSRSRNPPRSPYSIYARKSRFRRNSKKEGFELNGPLGELISNSALIPEIAGNFYGYRGRVERTLHRMKQTADRGETCRKSLSSHFANMIPMDKSRKNADNEEIKANNDTSTTCNLASPDFNACETSISEAEGACYTTPLRIQKDSYQSSPKCTEETPPRKRQYTRKICSSPQWCDDLPQMSTRSQTKSPTSSALATSDKENNPTPPGRRTNGAGVATRQAAQSARVGNCLSPYQRPPRSRMNKTTSALRPPSTPNTRSKQQKETVKFVEFDEQQTVETSFDSPSAVNSTNVAPDATGKFWGSLQGQLDFSEPKDDGDSVGSSHSVSQCLSQLSVSEGRSPMQDLRSPINRSPLAAIQKTFQKCSYQSLNIEELDGPFTKLDDSELRYIQACSSTVLAAAFASEDSMMHDSKRKSCSDLNASGKKADSNASEKNVDSNDSEKNVDSNTSEKNVCYPQPSGDSCQEEGKSSEEIRTRNKCDYPTYRFCFEFTKPERLEDSRFGLIFAARNRHDGRLYCIKKSRGFGDTLSSRNTMALEGRNNGPSFGEARKELQQEAMALGAISFHDHVVRYFSTWIEYDCVYLQLEFCNGGSLNDYMENKMEEYSLQKFRILQLMGDIGSAIKHVHEHGMVHLDLTPGNILIHFPAYHENINEQKETRDILLWRHFNIGRLMNDPSEKIIFKLADFGRSKYHTDKKIFDEVGDPEFMPPEVFGSMDGRMNDDVELFKIDVYSLGMTLYRAMGGERIKKFESDIERSDYHKHLMLPPKSDKQLSRFIQRSVKIPRLRPTIDDVLNFPGVCEASSSRHCMEIRIEQLFTPKPTARITRQHDKTAR